MAAPKKQPIELINGTYYINTEAAAQLCGVAKTTLIAWRKQPDAPIYDTELKMYALPDLGDWIRGEQIYKRGKGGVFPWKPDISRFPGTTSVKPTSPTVTILPGMSRPDDLPLHEDQDERVKRLRGDKIEMELQEKAGELVNGDEVVIVLSSMLSRVKTRLMGLPSSLAAAVTGKLDRIEVQAIIEDKLYSTLDELSTGPLKELTDADD